MKLQGKMRAIQKQKVRADRQIESSLLKRQHRQRRLPVAPLRLPRRIVGQKLLHRSPADLSQFFDRANLFPDKLTRVLPRLLHEIETEVGATVEEDDVLIIVESMKMEIPVEAPEDGRVVEIRVAEGQAIEEGDVLVVLEA